jgi:hypothetical protein
MVGLPHALGRRRGSYELCELHRAPAMVEPIAVTAEPVRAPDQAGRTATLDGGV